MDLLATEIRVLGCLVEKQHTTPDAYPLTLNSLRLACNQSTNRDPVVAYQESDLRDALHRLERRGYVRFAGGAGSRAPKYRHRLSERLPMDDAEQALMCVLMLRGAQTPGELKQRAERMHPFAGLGEVHETLQRLIERDLVTRLARRPGQKEERYGHLLEATEQGESTVSAPVGAIDAVEQEMPVPMPDIEFRVDEGVDELQQLRERVERLERVELRERVERLERELASLKADLGVGAIE